MNPQKRDMKREYREAQGSFSFPLLFLSQETGRCLKPLPLCWKSQSITVLNPSHRYFSCQITTTRQCQIQQRQDLPWFPPRTQSSRIQDHLAGHLAIYFTNLFMAPSYIWWRYCNWKKSKINTQELAKYQLQLNGFFKYMP